MGKTRDMSNLLNSTPADVDATSLDGASGEQYVRSDQADTTSSLTVQGDLNVSGTLTGSVDYDNITDLPDPTITLTGAVTGTGTMNELGSVSIATTVPSNPVLGLTGEAFGSTTILGPNPIINVTLDSNSVKNRLLSVDGAGSGIDADLVDGQEGTHYLDYNNFYNTTALLADIKDVDGAGSDLDADKLDGQHGSYYTTYTNISGTPTSITDLGVTDGQNGQYLVTDGSGGFAFQSLVIEGAADAATLDGLDSLQFLRSDVDTTSTATITANALAGPLTGNVTGNVTGAVTGNVTGDLTGNVTGDVTATTVDVTAHIDLNNTSNPSYSEGRIFYDNDNGALAVYNDESDVTLQVGQEEYVKVKNNTGATITNGSAVYLSGEDATVPTIVKATAATEIGSYAVGLATHDIETGTTGYVTTRGLVQGIDTSSLTAGERIHVGVTAGTIQTAAPTYPYFTTDIGICLVSNASTGCVYVDVQAHVFEVIRVTGNSHMDGNLTVDGNFTVNGTQTITSTTNIALSGSQQFLNSGDTILAATHTGTGLDDAVFRGHFTGTTSTTYYIKIDSVGGGTNGVDTFAVSTDNFTTTISSNNDLTDDAQLIHSADNISVEFNATTGHTLNDVWSGTAAPVDVDTGLWSNRNTGSTGIGYTNLGFYFDVSDTKWKLVDEYDPTPGNNIDVTDSSFSLGTLEAGGFEGPLTGAVTGNVTGNLTGNVTAGTITFGDNNKAIFGAGSDLEIYHDGSNSIVKDAGTGSLELQGSSWVILKGATSGNWGLASLDGAQTNLYHNGSLKLGTTATGIDITGNATFGDNNKAVFGAGSDLQIYHDGSNTGIQNATGELFIYGGGDQIRIRAENGEESIVANPNGSVDLYHNGSAKLATTATGIDVTGAIVASGDITAFSDERLKSDIETLDGSKVYEMRGVSFTKDGEASSGVIAQELQKVAPELVNENGEYLSVAYGNVVGYLIEAIKDLKSEIEELKKD